MSRKTSQPLYEKAYNRTVRDTKEERDAGYGRLVDFGRGYSVEMMWHTDQKAGENQIFQIRVKNRGLEEPIDLYLNAEQVMKFLRWV